MGSIFSVFLFLCCFYIAHVHVLENMKDPHGKILMLIKTLFFHLILQ